jgi:hypothetical protein
MSTPVDTQFDSYSDHPFFAEVNEFRNALLQADEHITETWKWNAPNFCIDGQDRVTLRLRPNEACHLILHRGAKVLDDSGFEFSDDTGWIEWKAPDRGVIVFDSPKDLRERTGAVVAMCQRWMHETAAHDRYTDT